MVRTDIADLQLSVCDHFQNEGSVASPKQNYLCESRKKMTEVVENNSNELLAELTAEVVAAYVSNNVVQTSDLSGLISDVYAALGNTMAPQKEPPAEKPKPAVSIKKSLQHEYLICLEDGKKFKSLKRHLMTHYGLSPEEYREKWDLPADYPMVAPAYAEARSRLAKEMGLGQKRKRSRR